MTKIPFKKVAMKNISYWESLSDEAKRRQGDLMAVFCFYLGDYKQGQEASYLHSLHKEEESLSENFSEETRISFLFDAGLNASLAQKQAKAKEIWQRLVQWRREWFPEKQVVKPQTANIWIYEAYALMKVERYSEVETPAQIGFEGLLKGKGLHPEPRSNEWVYGLVDVIKSLSAYKLNFSNERKRQAQQDLETYKEENFSYGKGGYGIIFDLQFSYPDVFVSILPGSSPEQD
ncbi:MAG: hypothetical protein KJ077_12975 [Anaerolineae bacterium]|nr:hypothetical protein [Anaerolineae bacterium]